VLDEQASVWEFFTSMKNLWFQFYKIKLEWFQFRFPKNVEPGTLVWFFNQIIPVQKSDPFQSGSR
jgi:hypothetical protein